MVKSVILPSFSVEIHGSLTTSPWGHRYMVYGKEGVFDADRLIDLLRALEVLPKKPRNTGDSLLVGGDRNMTFIFQIFPYIGNLIIPID